MGICLKTVPSQNGPQPAFFIAGISTGVIMKFIALLFTIVALTQQSFGSPVVHKQTPPVVFPKPEGKELPIEDAKEACKNFGDGWNVVEGNLGSGSLLCKKDERGKATWRIVVFKDGFGDTLHGGYHTLAGHYYNWPDVKAVDYFKLPKPILGQGIPWK